MKTVLLAAFLSLSLVAFGQTTVSTLPTNQGFLLQSSVTKTASFTGSNLTPRSPGRDLIVTLDVTAADAGTYDFYITTTDGVASWDIVHFPQITASAARYTAIVSGYGYPQNVTTATPGAVAVTTATLDTKTANVVGTLGAGLVRHGPWGRTVGYSLVKGGSATTGVTYSITVTAK